MATTSPASNFSGCHIRAPEDDFLHLDAEEQPAAAGRSGIRGVVCRERGEHE